MSDILPQQNTQNDGSNENLSQFYQQKEKDKNSNYFSERAKKLTTAIYLVTNLIPQTDPLRQATREMSIKLLSSVGLSANGLSFTQIATEVSSLCRKILEMLEIAYFSGYVSEMNFSVLKGEFDVFANEIIGYQSPQASLDQESLKVEFLKKPLSLNSQTFSRPKGQNRHGQNTAQKQAVLQSPVQQVETKKPIEVKKESRRETILSIIKMKGAVGIKDISAVIVDCSEKTVQRELHALVSDGTLKKSGDRRWSVYSFI